MKLNQIKPLKEDEDLSLYEEMERWLADHFKPTEDYDGGNLDFNENNEIDYNGDVALARIDEIKYQFDHVGGDFKVIQSVAAAGSKATAKNLTSLKNCPQSVAGSFVIQGQQITTLEHSPEHVGDAYVISRTKLTSLKGITADVTHLEIVKCGLTNLDHFPRVEGQINISENNLTSLRGIPKHVGGHFYCAANQLSKVEELPETISGDLDISHNKFTSLKDIHKHVKSVKGEIAFGTNPIKSHILGLLLIQGVTKFDTINLLSSGTLKDETDVKLHAALNILNKHVGQGKAGMIAAQTELMDNDLDEYAEL